MERRRKKSKEGEENDIPKEEGWGYVVT